MQDYIRYLDGTNNEWRLIVKDYELDGNIQPASLEAEVMFAKEAGVGICVDLTLVERIQDSAYAVLAEWHSRAKLQEVKMRYITKDECVKYVLNSIQIEAEMKSGKSTKFRKKDQTP